MTKKYITGGMKHGRKQKSKRGRDDQHFCWVCGEHMAHEKFSGRGHATNMCKKCNGLPVTERNEMATIRKVQNMAFRWLSDAEINWLRKRLNDRNPNVSEVARETYRIKFPNHDCVRDLTKKTEIKLPVRISELEDEQRANALTRLEELICEFFVSADYHPDFKDRDRILGILCEEVSETLNICESEPYCPVTEYGSLLEYDPELSFDDNVALFHQVLDAESEACDLYAEPEEPMSPPQRELIVDSELITIYANIVTRYVTEDVT